MTAKAKAAINRFEAEQFELRDKVAARLQKLSSSQRLRILVSVGVLTENGKLSSAYRPRRLPAAVLTGSTSRP